MSAADEKHWRHDPEDLTDVLDLEHDDCTHGRIVLDPCDWTYQLKCKDVDLQADDGPAARRYAVDGVRQQLVGMLAALDRMEKEP